MCNDVDIAVSIRCLIYNSLGSHTHGGERRTKAALVCGETIARGRINLRPHNLFTLHSDCI